MSVPEPLEDHGHGWLAERVGSNRAHALPLEDLVEHEPTDFCLCGPRIEPIIGSSCVVVHASLDGRELTEAA